MNIRLAQVDDAAALASVHVATWRAAYRQIMPERMLAALSVERFEENWRTRLLNPTRTNLVCEFDGQVIGFAACGPCRDEDAEPATVGELYGLYVHPQHWGRKAGWMLWSSALDVLTQQGYQEVVLWVIEANHRARHFYERAGFALEAGAVKQFQRDGVSLPELRYRKDLIVA